MKCPHCKKEIELDIEKVNREILAWLERVRLMHMASANDMNHIDIANKTSKHIAQAIKSAYDRKELTK